jgi:GNAT superfamily N-acetyltransferase
MSDITLEKLKDSDRDRFVLDNQEAFRYGATEEFGLRDDHFEEPGEIISRATIEESIDKGEAYRIVLDGRNVGGAIVSVSGERGDLQILFVSPEEHSKGIGYQAWCAIERMYPQVRVWETCTPYFEKRNIHFYVNRCGFHITRFSNKHNPDPNDPDDSEMFHFEKVMF